MKRLCVSLAALVATSAAFAADLPTKKAPVVPEKPNCFASLYSYFDSTPADCPLTYWGLTFYATVDMGVGYQTHGTPFNRNYPTGVEELISKNSNRGQWLLTPGGISQSQVGVKIKEPLFGGLSFVGEVATGFDPYSLRLADGPRSMANNTAIPLQFQSSNGDSSRAGQWDNSVGYAGFSQEQFGTLTFGRQNTLSLDGINAYDPMGGSYAFSPIGYSGRAAGDGNTETARSNTALKYAGKFGNFRVNGLLQIGGYNLGNASNGMYQVGVGADFYGVSLDAIYTNVKDQVALATYNGIAGGPGQPAGYGLVGLPAGVPSNALKATLSNNNDLMILGKYKWNQFTLFGGFEYIRYSNPTDAYPNGFKSIGGFPVLPGAVTSNNYNIPLNFDILWTGVKYAINDRLDVTGAYYLYIQNNFEPNAANCGPNTTVVTGYNLKGTASGKCQGYLNAFSAMLDYRPLKRVDLYAGFMYSTVSGGLASGFLNSSNFDPTIGVRVRF